MNVSKIIRREHGKWVLYSLDGSKRLGTFATKEEAERRERQIRYFKHLRKGGEDMEFNEAELEQYLSKRAQVGTNPADYAYVPDPDHPSTWKLPLVDETGKMTARQIGMAIAALGKGFRGKKVQIPAKDLPGVKRKILAAWKKVHPDAKPEDIPNVLKHEQGGNSNMTVEELEKKLGELEAQLDEATQAVEKAEKRAATVINLSPEHQEIFKSWDEETQSKFLDASEEDQTEMLEKAAKSAGPDIPEGVPEEVQKRFDEVRKKLEEAEERAKAAEEVAKAEREARHMQELMKRAETEFSALPGTCEEKAQVLKSLDKLEEKEREAVLKLFAAGNSCIAKSMSPVGKDSDAAEGSSAWSTIEKRAKAVADEKNVTLSEAVDIVLKRDPELYSKYLEEQGK